MFCTSTQNSGRVIALYNLFTEAKTDKQRLGILDQNKYLLTEIVGKDHKYELSVCNHLRSNRYDNVLSGV